MRELAFAGLTDDGDLLLTAGDGQQFSLGVDDRLAAAVRGDRPRLGQLSIALDGVSPRDIQTRVRHGQSPDEVAEQSGIPLERVLRFAGPPLAEREHVAGLARQTEVRRPQGDAALEQLVTATLDAAGVMSAPQWDSWRREDGRWTVLVTWTGGGDQLALGAATWTFDSTGRTLVADDDGSRCLQGEQAAADSSDVGRLLRVVADDSDVDVTGGPVEPWAEGGSADWDRGGAVRRVGHADPDGNPWGAGRWGDNDDPDAALTAVVDRYSGEVLDLEPGPPREPGDLTPLDDLLHTLPGLARTHARTSRRDRRKSTKATQVLEPAAELPMADDAATPATPRRTSTRTNKPRAVVPSWDEILFGSRRTED
ncbi:MAG: septation protein SepH [Candidatus Nanopelagicales bacterium]